MLNNRKRMDPARRYEIERRQMFWANIKDLVAKGYVRVSGRNKDGDDLYQLTEAGLAFNRAMRMAPDEDGDDE